MNSLIDRNKDNFHQVIDSQIGSMLRLRIEVEVGWMVDGKANGIISKIKKGDKK